MAKITLIFLLISCLVLCPEQGTSQDMKMIDVHILSMSDGVSYRTKEKGELYLTYENGESKMIKLNGTGLPTLLIGIQIIDNLIYVATGNPWLDKVFVNIVDVDGKQISNFEMERFRGLSNEYSGANFTVDEEGNFFILRKISLENETEKDILEKYNAKGKKVWEYSDMANCETCKDLVITGLRQVKKGTIGVFRKGLSVSTANFSSNSRTFIGHLDEVNNPKNLIEHGNSKGYRYSDLFIPKAKKTNISKIVYDLDLTPQYAYFQKNNTSKQKEIVIINPYKKNPLILKSDNIKKSAGTSYFCLDEKGNIIVSYSIKEKKAINSGKKKRKYWTNVIDVFNKNGELISSKYYNNDTRLKIGQFSMYVLMPIHCYDGNCLFIDRTNKRNLLASYDLSNITLDQPFTLSKTYINPLDNERWNHTLVPLNRETSFTYRIAANRFLIFTY